MNLVFIGSKGKNSKNFAGLLNRSKNYSFGSSQKDYGITGKKNSSFFILPQKSVKYTSVCQEEPLLYWDVSMLHTTRPQSLPLPPKTIKPYKRHHARDFWGVGRHKRSLLFMKESTCVCIHLYVHLSNIWNMQYFGALQLLVQ